MEWGNAISSKWWWWCWRVEHNWTTGWFGWFGWFGWKCKQQWAIWWIWSLFAMREGCISYWYNSIKLDNWFIS